MNEGHDPNRTVDGIQKRLRQVELACRRLQLALAAAVLLLLLGGGAFAWWQNEQASERRLADERAAAETARLESERQVERARHQLAEEQRAAAERNRRGRNAEAVAALLGQCEEALRAGDAAKASMALETAKKRSAEGGAEEQAARLGRLDADLALLRDLDAIDQFRWTVVENQFPDPAVLATRSRGALRRFGANPDAVSVEEAAARVSASAVRERIVTALDRLLRQERTAGVRAALRLVDADPCRNAVRDAVLANDRAQLVALVAQEEALQHPPGFAAFLGESEVIGVERRRQLLQSAVSRRSGDLGLLMTLGLTYINQKEGTDERLRWAQAAVAVAPTNAAAHNNLGIALTNKGQWDAAIACFHKAIALDPRYASAFYNLGEALSGKGQVDAAIACYQKAIALDPKLGGVRSDLARAERIAAVRDRLPAFQNGSYKPGSTAERLGLAEWCQIKKLYRTATGLYAAAFATDPKLATDLHAGHRYHAACAAALAVADQGEEVAKLDAKERASLRNQALDWLRADLMLCTKRLGSGTSVSRAMVRQQLQHWQQESALAYIRDPAALANLSAEERAACTQLWADVATLLKKTEAPTKKETQP